MRPRATALLGVGVIRQSDLPSVLGTIDASSVEIQGDLEVTPGATQDWVHALRGAGRMTFGRPKGFDHLSMFVALFALT